MSKLFLVGDVGGTNTNLALAKHDQSGIHLVRKARFSTQQEKSLLAPVERFLEAAREQGFVDIIDFCCISGAGPVQPDESIQLTNAPWSIRASELSSVLKIPVKLINDFTALSYAVTLLDYRDTDAVTQLPHPDGSLYEPRDGIMLVIGAGTGLGVGFVDRIGNNIVAFPSEGGHSEMPCFDDLSHAVHRWLSNKYGYSAGAELVISGQGIANIFEFVCSDEFRVQMLTSDYAVSHAALTTGLSETAKHILALPRPEWPANIALHAENDVFCTLAMELFGRLYALKAANLASIFLPAGGIWLAGGISSKNEAWLLKNARFMRWFEKNYAPHIRQFLAHTPVLIVKNYDISLLGAAVAALQLSAHD
ncbi:MAG: glucokinase [Rectinema sp.]